MFVQPQSMREAAQLDAEGRCAEAESYYQAALAAGSPSPALLNNAGNHYVVCGQPAQARSYFEKLVQINPAHVNANLQLARIAVEGKLGTKALEYLARVKESDPSTLLLRAEALHWAGKSAASLFMLDEAAKAARGDARLLFLLGISCGRLALYDRAEEAFNSALALQPDDFDILFNLGRAAARAQHYERAQRALETALKIRPGDVVVLTELGTVCMSREDCARAVFVLAQARKLAPRNPQILRMLARAAEDAGYHEDAVTAYDEYLRLRPDDDVARRDRARACGYTETRQEEARKELTRYLGKHPNDAEAHYIFAEVFWWPEPEESLQHLTEAVRLDPKSVQIRFSRAWMLQRVGKIAESLPDLDAANREAPDNVRILDLIGLARLALDQPAEAEKVLRRALAKAPEDPEVVLHLGRALMALGRDTEAQTYLEKYRTIRRPGLQRLRQRPGMFELATLSAAKQRELEIERFRSAAREHPDHPDYQLHLSRMLLADGQRDAALQEFRTLLAMNANSHIREDAGTLLLSAGEYAPAREFLERAAEERPSARLDLAIAVFQADGAGPALEVLDKVPAGELSADTLLLKADLLEAAGRRAEAEKTLDRWAGQASARPRVVLRAIPLLVRLNRKDAALTLLEQAIRTNPQDPDLPLTKAVVEGLTDRYPSAEKTLRDVEQRLPEWDRAYFAHGLMLERAGRLGEARQKFQTASALGSRDPGLRCALARLARAAEATPECACLAGLEQLLFGGCKR